MVDGTAKSSELGIFGVEGAGGAEDHLPINGSPGSDQFSLHVDSEQSVECRWGDLVGAGDDDRLTGDVLVIEVDAGPQECVKRE